MDSINIVEIILAVGGLSALIGVLLQHVQFNKKMQVQKEELEKKYQKNKSDIGVIRSNMTEYKQNINRVNGVLYDLLYSVSADRVYIVQPYPLDETVYMSVFFEVKARGVADVKDVFHKLLLKDYMFSYDMLKTNDFLLYNDTRDIEDVKVRSLVSLNGGKSVACYRLLDSAGRYVGSLICEWMDGHILEDDFMKDKLLVTSSEIQYCLPPLEE